MRVVKSNEAGRLYIGVLIGCVGLYLCGGC